MSDAAGPEFPGIRTLTAGEMFALDLNATALAEEARCAAFWLDQEKRGYPVFRESARCGDQLT